ncbi:MAG: AAA family ATPase, partial [Deltaproteobacteria bacterium]
VLILTSNVGSQHIMALDDEAAMRASVMEDLRRGFRPEFLNRLDEVIIFHRLQREQLRSIVDIQLRRFGERLARRDLRVTVDDAAKDYLGEVGWDPVYGARPLKRAIQQYVENPLAQRILAGEFAPGDIIQVSRVGTGPLQFSRAQLN